MIIRFFSWGGASTTNGGEDTADCYLLQDGGGSNWWQWDVSIAVRERGFDEFALQKRLADLWRLMHEGGLGNE